MKYHDSAARTQYTDAFVRSFQMAFQASRDQWSSVFLYTPSERFVADIDRMLTQLGFSGDFAARFTKDLASCQEFDVNKVCPLRRFT